MCGLQIRTIHPVWIMQSSGVLGARATPTPWAAHMIPGRLPMPLVAGRGATLGRWLLILLGVVAAYVIIGAGVAHAGSGHPQSRGHAEHKLPGTIAANAAERKARFGQARARLAEAAAGAGNSRTATENAVIAEAFARQTRQLVAQVRHIVHNDGSRPVLQRALRAQRRADDAAASASAAAHRGHNLARKATAHRAAGQKPVDGAQVHTGGWVLRTRQAAGPDAPVITKLSNGTPLDVYCATNAAGQRWLKVRSGFVDARYVRGQRRSLPACPNGHQPGRRTGPGVTSKSGGHTTDRQTSRAAGQKPVDGAQVHTGGWVLRTRQAAGPDAPVITKLSNGTPLDVYCATNAAGQRWLKVRSGFVDARYVRGQRRSLPACPNGHQPGRRTGPGVTSKSGGHTTDRQTSRAAGQKPVDGAQEQTDESPQPSSRDLKPTFRFLAPQPMPWEPIADWCTILGSKVICLDDWHDVGLSYGGTVKIHCRDKWVESLYVEVPDRRLPYYHDEVNRIRAAAQPYQEYLNALQSWENEYRDYKLDSGPQGILAIPPLAVLGAHSICPSESTHFMSAPDGIGRERALEQAEKAGDRALEQAEQAGERALEQAEEEATVKLGRLAGKVSPWSEGYELACAVQGPLHDGAREMLNGATEEWVAAHPRPVWHGVHP